VRLTLRTLLLVVAAAALGSCARRASWHSSMPENAWTTVETPRLIRNGESWELQVISTFATGTSGLVLVRCQGSALSGVEAFADSASKMRWSRPCRLEDVHTDTVAPNRVVTDTGRMSVTAGQLKEVQPGSIVRAIYGARAIGKLDAPSTGGLVVFSMPSNPFRLAWDGR
jgi:hypothetical protein